MADWDTTPGRTGRRTIDQIMDKTNSGSSSSSSGSDNSSDSSSSSDSDSTKKTKVKPDLRKTYKEVPIPVPKKRYGMPSRYSVSRAGVELYETDEDNYEPYVPTGSAGGGTTTVEDESVDSDDEDNTPGFSLHMGEVLKIHYEDELNSISFESDYKDMNNNASIRLDDINLKKAYKGVRLKLLSEWDSIDKIKFQWEDLKEAIEGFITEQKFTDTEVEVTVSGMTKTLEMKYKFDFKQMYRSEIINQVILTAGLKPVLNFEGLEDDIIDFKNYSESDSSSGSTGDVKIKSTGSKVLDEVVKKAIAGKTDDLEKAKAIFEAFKEHCYYEGYSDCQYPNDIEKAWNDAHINCADGANVLCAMYLAAGLNSVIVHVNNHYIVKTEINGKSYLSDSSGAEGAHNTRPFGEVFTYDGVTSGSVVGTHLDY